MPLTGLEDPRPAVEAASKPRMNKKALPFDPTDFMEYDIPYSEGDAGMADWGSAGR